MTRKPLPKAITRPISDLRKSGAGPATDEEVAAPRLVARTPLPTASICAEPRAIRRRSLARKIVERHKTYAAVSGLCPLPIVNIAGVTAVIMRMVKQLSDVYGVPFERDRTRSMIVGLMGGAVPTGLATATTSTLIFVIPGSAFVGLAVSAISAGALTRGIGLVFLEHFESESMSLGAAEAVPA